MPAISWRPSARKTTTGQHALRSQAPDSAGTDEISGAGRDPWPLSRKTKADLDKLDQSDWRSWPKKIRLSASGQNEETGQTIISGMGEFHLEILVDRLLREFGVQANVGSPKVAYKETITTSVECEGRFVRQSGGRGQFGHVVMGFEPTERRHRISILRIRSLAARFRASIFLRSNGASRKR